MSTFTRLPSGKVILTTSAYKVAFNPTMNILPHPREEDMIIITDDANNQETGKGYICRCARRERHPRKQTAVCEVKQISPQCGGFPL